MKNPITAKRLALALSNKNMIPQELANASGVSKASISQYLNGSHSPSNISSQKMASVLNVNPLWLMGFDVPMVESFEIMPNIKEEKELNQIFAQNITHQLDINNKTQLDLAEYMNVSQATVSNWCKGIKSPRMDKIDAMCKFFNIKRSDLMEEQKEEIPHPCKELTDIYVQLSDNNQGKVLQYSKNLLSSQQMEKEAELLAAHARTTIESTEDGLKQDLDIMNNDDMWK